MKALLYIVLMLLVPYYYSSLRRTAAVLAWSPTSSRCCCSCVGGRLLAANAARPRVAAGWISSSTATTTPRHYHHHHHARPQLLSYYYSSSSGFIRLLATNSGGGDEGGGTSTEYYDEDGRLLRRRRQRRQPEVEEDTGWENFDPLQQQQQQQQQQTTTSTGEWEDYDDDDDWYVDDDQPSRRRPSKPTSKQQTRREPPPIREDTGWENFDPLQQEQRRKGWDDTGNDDDWDDYPPPRPRSSPKPKRRQQREGNEFPRSSRNNNRGHPRSSRGSSRESNNSRYRQKDSKSSDRKTNLKALERAGFDHLYGIASVLNALETAKRDFTRPEDVIDLDALDGEMYEHERKQRERKPEAQFSPWLFVQESSRGGSGNSKRSADKAAAAAKILELAESRGIPVATVDKGVLNTLSNNRPHQGFVLRCGRLYLDSIVNLPYPDSDNQAPNFWLVLDEIVDPQNFGALLRSAYFLSGEGEKKCGVLICAKNSAPPSAVVSAASAGALEVIPHLLSTSSLPRTLANAERDGFRIIGASATSVEGTGAQVYDLQDLPRGDDRPTLLVLGSEGHGLRHLVSVSCTEFVRIPSGQGTDITGVDSLNVSVTGGILLWHILQNR